MADKPFTSLQDYCKLLSQQEVVQATPMVMTEEALPCVQEECSAASASAAAPTRNWLSETPPGHVQRALLVLPAQHPTPGLEELALSKDSKRTGNFSWLFTDTVT